MPIYIGYRQEEGKPQKIASQSLTILKQQMAKHPQSTWDVSKVQIKGTEALLKAILTPKKLEALERTAFKVSEGGKVSTVKRDD